MSYTQLNFNEMKTFKRSMRNIFRLNKTTIWSFNPSIRRSFYIILKKIGHLMTKKLSESSIFYYHSERQKRSKINNAVWWLSGTEERANKVFQWSHDACICLFYCVALHVFFFLFHSFLYFLLLSFFRILSSF